MVTDTEALLAPFRGKLTRYIDPSEPVGTEEWEPLG